MSPRGLHPAWAMARIQGLMPVIESNGVLDDDFGGGRSVLLRPGDHLFGRGDVRVSAVLGACVALVLWSPRFRLGAVCVCLRPDRGVHALGHDAADIETPGAYGAYGDEAEQWLQARLCQAGRGWGDFELSLVGGATGKDLVMGPRNIAWAQGLAARHSLPLSQQDVGGRVLRRLVFNLGDGSLTIAHGGRLGCMDL